MNDDELMTAVRADFAPVRMSVPADEIMARGRAARRLRHGQVGAGALAVALVVGLGIPALTSGGTAPGIASGGAGSGVTLTAWTVDKQPHGAIKLTIRELRDLPALQARLTADGARVVVGPGSVTAAPGPESVTPPAGCQAGAPNQGSLPAGVTADSTTDLSFTIQPATIPAGDVVRIAVTKGGAPMSPGSPADPAFFAVLVHDSPRCGF